MKNRKHLQWLYRELPALMNDGVLTAEAAEKLRANYLIEALHPKPISPCARE